jgi:predicted dehydrogenase
VVDGLANHRIESGNPNARQAQYILDCVRDGVEPEFCPIEDAVVALAVALAARESLASGAPVPISLVE